MGRVKLLCQCTCDATLERSETSSTEDREHDSDSSEVLEAERKAAIEVTHGEKVRRKRRERRRRLRGEHVIVPRALFVFSKHNAVRRTMLQVAGDPLFDAFILLAILANVVMLALETPDVDPESPMANGLNIGNMIVMGIFTVECGIKVVAYGFVMHEGTYLRSHWNKLDFTIVCLGFLFLIPAFGGLSAFRALRVLRALKSVKAVPGLRTIVETLVSSIGPLLYVLVLELIFITLFSIVGYQLFGGKLRNRCLSETWAFAPDDALCRTTRECVALWGEGWQCQPEGDNPGFGYLGFDHYGISFLSLLQVFTLDSWDEDVMDKIIKTTGLVSLVYFLVGVMIGAFFVTNLMLAVAANSYERSQHQKAEAHVAVVHELSDVSEPTFDFSTGGYTVREGSGQVRVDVILRLPPGVPHDKTFSVKFVTKDGTAVSDTSGLPPDYGHVEGTLTFEPGTLRMPIVIPVFDDDQAEEDEKFYVHLDAPSNGAVLGKQNVTTVTVVDDDDPGVFMFKQAEMATDLRPAEFSFPVLRDEGADGTATVDYVIENRSAVEGVDFICPPGTLTFHAGERKKLVHGKVVNCETWARDKDFVVGLTNFSHGAGIRKGANRLKVLIVTQEPHAVRRWCRAIIFSEAFQWFIVLVIMANTVCLAVESPQNSKAVANNLRVIDWCFLAVFFLELCLKLVGLKFFMEWLPERMNVFDAVVVAVGILEVVAYLTGLDNYLPGLSALRALRLLRVFKLMRKWKSLRKIITSVVRSLSSVTYLALIIILYLVIFALMGMQLFGGKYDTPLLDPKPRFNFDSFFWSLMSIFRILIGQWAEGMRYAAVATTPLACVFFIFVMVVGIFLVLNLFLAILLNSFAEAEQEISELDRNMDRGAHLDQAEKYVDSDRAGNESSGGGSRPPSDAPSAARIPSSAADVVSGGEALPLEGSGTATSVPPLPASVGVALEEEREKKEAEALARGRAPGDKRLSAALNRLAPAEIKRKSIFRWKKTSAAAAGEEQGYKGVESLEEKRMLEAAALSESSLFLLPPRHPVRLVLQRVVNHRVFEWSVQLVVLASSLSLAFERPGDIPQWQLWLNAAFACFFFAEMTMQVLFRGLWMHQGAYLRDWWNVLDFAMVTISIVSVSVTLSGWDSMESRVIRALRTFRPLRAVRRYEGIRIVVYALVSSVPSIFNVILVCILFYVTFAILGVQLFGGMFAFCSNREIATRDACLGAGERWKSVYYNFDNVAWALVSLVKIATFDGWHELFYLGIDVVDIGVAPREDAAQYNAVYFVVFIVFGSFFILNLFVGVVIEQFNVLKQKFGGMALLSQKENEFMHVVDTLKLFRPTVQVREMSGLAGTLQRAVLSPTFEFATMVLIALNVLLMASEHFRPTPSYNEFTYIANMIFAILFLMEAVLKVMAMGTAYFRDRWHLFDFFVVCTTVISFLPLSAVSEYNLGTVKAFRIARVFKILRNVERLKKLMTTLVYAAPSLVNIGSLLFLLLFIYSVLGVSLFGALKKTPPLSDDINFDDFGHAFHILFKLSTGPGWSAFLSACSNQQDCDASKGECGSAFVALPFFLSFLVAMTFVMINLYIAVILEAFDKVENEEEAMIRPKDIVAFNEEWSKIDRKATYKMPLRDVARLLKAVPYPLGYKNTVNGHAETHVLETLLDPDDGPTVQVLAGTDEVLYSDLLLAMIKHAMQVEIPAGQLARIEQGVANILPSRMRRGVAAKTTLVHNSPGKSGAHASGAESVREASEQGSMLEVDVEHAWLAQDPLQDIRLPGYVDHTEEEEEEEEEESDEVVLPVRVAEVAAPAGEGVSEKEQAQKGRRKAAPADNQGEGDSGDGGKAGGGNTAAAEKEKLSPRSAADIG